MFRGLLMVAIASGVLAAWPSASDAYSTPSGLTPSASASVCPPRPSDVSSGEGTAVLVAALDQSIPSGTWTTLGSAGSTTGGPASVTFTTSSSGTGSDLSVQVEDSSGTWQTVSQWNGQEGLGSFSTTVQVPAGPVRLQVFVGSGSAQPFWGWLTVPQPAVSGQVTVQQELADACYRNEQLASQAHMDAGAIDSDVQAVKSAVNGLTSSGATLHTLDLDLQQLDTDVKATTAAVQAGGGSSDPSATVPQLVELSSADRQQSADEAASLAGDLWVIVGSIVGCFVGVELLRRLLP